MCVNASSVSFVVEPPHLFHALYDGVVHGGVGEETPHVGVGAPQVVFDHLTAAQVLDGETEAAITFVRLVQRGVGVRTDVLKTEHSTGHMITLDNIPLTFPTNTFWILVSCSDDDSYIVDGIMHGF